MPSALCKIFHDRSAAIVSALSEHRLKRYIVDDFSSSLGEASQAIPTQRYMTASLASNTNIGCALLFHCCLDKQV